MKLHGNPVWEIIYTQTYKCMDTEWVICIAFHFLLIGWIQACRGMATMNGLDTLQSDTDMALLFIESSRLSI